MQTESFRVAGVTFHERYPDSLHDLDLENMGTLPLRLQREPWNEYDENAIAVMREGDVIGHIPRDLAAKLAPLIDESIDSVRIVRYQVMYDGRVPDKPGLKIEYVRETEYETY